MSIKSANTKDIVTLKREKRNLITYTVKIISDASHINDKNTLALKDNEIMYLDFTIITTITIMKERDN